jgi:hypothetical protein
VFDSPDDITPQISSEQDINPIQSVTACACARSDVPSRPPVEVDEGSNPRFARFVSLAHVDAETVVQTTSGMSLNDHKLVGMPSHELCSNAPRRHLCIVLGHDDSLASIVKILVNKSH